MLKQKLIALKEHILQYNTYFNNAYEYAEQNEEGIINAARKPIFPNDTLGDYFYFRLPSNIKFEYGRQYDIAEGINGAGLSSQIVLVACVKGADNDQLATDLVNTIQTYQPDNIKLTSVIYEPIAVVAQELVKIGKENLQAALQKLPEEYTIVSISFSFIIPFAFSKPSCITKPCKSC